MERKRALIAYIIWGIILSYVFFTKVLFFDVVFIIDFFKVIILLSILVSLQEFGCFLLEVYKKRHKNKR